MNKYEFATSKHLFFHIKINIQDKNLELITFDNIELLEIRHSINFVFLIDNIEMAYICTFII